RGEALQSLRWVYQLHYANNANPQPRLLQAIAGRGFGLECVSPGELDVAARAVPAAARLVTPNFARREDSAVALKPGDLVPVDALHPLEHWGELFTGQSIMLRVDLGRGLGHHEKVRTGGSGSKFGLPLDRLDRFLQLAWEHDVRVHGLHAHLGSGVLDA